ncbi:MAG: radical SAM protein [Dehalococcoidales bacterium]|nr:MAG: radical SAM protein [Dehalococcoidales bacterium]
MSIKDFTRNQIRKSLTKESTMILENKIPSYENLEIKFQDIAEFGLYLHIPFCRQICPYCPYNKEIYHPETARMYTKALIKEIDFYSGLFGNKPVTSFYIGGGTPTTMLRNGLDDILEYIYKRFNMQCDIHMESHPNDLTSDNLNIIRLLNVANLSTGVESLQDKYLQILDRPYNTKEVKEAIERAGNKGFKCFNVDFIFALPDQSYDELEQAGRQLVKMNIDQVAAYPLWRFPYTKMGESTTQSNYNVQNIFKRRKMLRILEDIFYGSNYERTSVWAFTKKEMPKYCSVTVPLYIGLGASGGTYLRDIFYLNTFNVAEYIKRLDDGRMPIALSLELSERMQMAWWIYWRVYETRFKRSDFEERFGSNFNQVWGKYINLFHRFGFVKEDDTNEIILADRGTYWLHAFEDLFSLDYISKLWGTSKQHPWPEKVIL